MKRRIMVLIGLVVAVAVAIGVWQLLSNLDAIIASAIEKYGSRSTGTSVAVADVHVDLRAGRGEIGGLTVDNPDGFGGGHAFALGDVVLDLDVGSVRENPVVIDEITVGAPQVSLVFDAKGGSNLDTLRKRLQELAPSGGAGGDGGAGGEHRLRIRRFTISQGSIAVDASALGLEPRTLELPTIRLDDIGGPQGADGAGVARAVLDAVIDRALKTAASSEVQRAVKDKLRDAVDDAVGDKAKGLLDKIGG